MSIINITLVRKPQILPLQATITTIENCFNSEPTIIPGLLQFMYFKLKFQKKRVTQTTIQDFGVTPKIL